MKKYFCFLTSCAAPKPKLDSAKSKSEVSPLNPRKAASPKILRNSSSGSTEDRNSHWLNPCAPPGRPPPPMPICSRVVPHESYSFRFVSSLSTWKFQKHRYILLCMSQAAQILFCEFNRPHTLRRHPGISWEQMGHSYSCQGGTFWPAGSTLFWFLYRKRSAGHRVHRSSLSFCLSSVLSNGCSGLPLNDWKDQNYP